MIRVGLLGVGFIGATHAACYKNIAGARLVAVADVNREAADRVAAEHGARAYYAVEPLLEDKEVDAVDICLPTFLHEQTVVSAAEAGKHILCEKPIARHLGEVDHMLGVNSHPVSFASYSSQFVEGFLDMATGRGVPIVTGEEWLDLTLTRYEIEFESIAWQDSTLRFVLRAGARPGEVTVMVPLGQRKIGRVTVDGAEGNVTMARLWGREYALLHLAEPQPTVHVQVDFIP